MLSGSSPDTKILFASQVGQRCGLSWCRSEYTTQWPPKDLTPHTGYGLSSLWFMLLCLYCCDTIIQQYSYTVCEKKHTPTPIHPYPYIHTHIHPVCDWSIYIYIERLTNHWRCLTAMTLCFMFEQFSNGIILNVSIIYIFKIYSRVSEQLTVKTYENIFFVFIHFVIYFAG